MIKARWVQIHQQSGPYQQWAAVDEDDEIIATVSGDGQMWNATLSGSARNGCLITEEAAKRRVEKWLHPGYTFQVSPTAWVFKC